MIDRLLLFPFANQTRVLIILLTQDGSTRMLEVTFFLTGGTTLVNLGVKFYVHFFVSDAVDQVFLISWSGDQADLFCVLPGNRAE